MISGGQPPPPPTPCLRPCLVPFLSLNLKFNKLRFKMYCYFKEMFDCICACIHIFNNFTIINP